MPTTFSVATHKANRVDRSWSTANSPRELLDKTWGRFNKKVVCEELLQSSMGPARVPARLTNTLFQQRNGFVDTILSAYNNHHHLTIRPDDVWMAILGQFNFYVNAHAEELRSFFVAHEGKREVVVYDVGTRYTVDFGVLATRLSDEIDKNLVDKDLKDWILPNFTTTTHNDTVICSVLMMATLNAYFDRKIVLRCGIPTVTLEGEKQDYEKLLARLDKLSSFGPEPEAWAAMLRPIISRFVSAFDSSAEKTKSETDNADFWNRVCHVHPGGSGPSYLSGWITAFCVWTNEGKWLGPQLPIQPPNTDPSSSSNQESQITPPTPARRPFGMLDTPRPLVLDTIQYPLVETTDVPVGFCEVGIKLDDNGEMFDCMMVAGHLASVVEGKGADSLRPAPAWFMFIQG